MPFENTHHNGFLLLGHFGAQLQAGGDRHCLLDGQVAVQLVVLHDVGTEFAELAQVALFAVHFDDAILDVGRPARWRMGIVGMWR